MITAKQLRPRKKRKSRKKNSAIIKDIESKLRSALGTKVQMKTFLKVERFV